MKGDLRMGPDGKFNYVDEQGNWRKCLVWVQGTKLCIAKNAEAYKRGEWFSIEGEFISIDSVPVATPIES